MKHIALIFLASALAAGCTEPTVEDELTTLAAQYDERFVSEADPVLDPVIDTEDLDAEAARIGAGCSPWNNPDGTNPRWECCVSGDDWQICCDSNGSCN